VSLGADGPRPPAAAAGTLAIAGELRVNRLGLGALRLPGARGAPRPDAARDLLREAVRLGVELIDTARSYGRSEELIAEALHPYPHGLVIATKGGLGAGGARDGRPERLRAECEESLRRLRLERIDLWQLHRIDPRVPLEEQLGAVRDLRDEGKIRLFGLSQVTVPELRRARGLIEVATVQNRYSVADRASDDVVAECERGGIGFLPWFPLALGRLADAGGPLARVAARRGATPARVALAWLLRRSPVMLPIPGTGAVAHLRENVAAAGLALDDADVAELRAG
jgi:aryl-alcohol dehydrogenase-like predicted oxidoreductase